MKFSAKSLISLILIMMLAVLSACSSGTKSDSSPNTANGNTTNGNTAATNSGNKSNGGEKSVVIGITNPPVTLNPVNANDNASIYVSNIMYDSLLELVETMEFLPKLANSFETADNQNYVVKLNPNAKWTDGQPVTTQDIVFTLELIANPDVPTIGSSYISMIDGLTENGNFPAGTTTISGLKIVDDTTLEIKTKVPLDPVTIKEQIGTKIRFLPHHILKEVPKDQLATHPYMQNPDVTNGPFKYVAFEKDQYVEFAANKDYYRGTPKLDKLFVKIMPAANLVAQLQTGDIHMNITGIGNIAVSDFERVKNLTNVRTISGKPFNFQIMFINNETLPQKVRQAIAYGINREMIVNNLLKGEGEVIDGPYTTIHPYFNPEYNKYNYDIETAKTLLAESGWDKSKVINLTVPTGNKTREQSGDIIAENLKEIGFNVEIQKYDFPTVMQKGKAHEFDLLLFGLLFNLDPDISTYYQTGVEYNYSSFSNTEMDRLLKEGLAEADSAKRHVIYDRIQEIAQEELPFLTLYADYRLKAVSKKVTHGEPKELGMFYDLHEWDIEP